MTTVRNVEAASMPAPTARCRYREMEPSSPRTDTAYGQSRSPAKGLSDGYGRTDAGSETRRAYTEGGKRRRMVGWVLRFLGWWFGFSGLYAMFAVCPFCGQSGCPVGAGTAGIVGGFFAILSQNWKALLFRLRGVLKGRKGP